MIMHDETNIDVILEYYINDDNNNNDDNYDQIGWSHETSRNKSITSKGC